MTDEGFRIDKFRELVLYVAELSRTDERFGRTKLHKILFYADMLAFADLGQPITGAAYQKQEWGPMATPLGQTVRDLVDGAEAAWIARSVFDHEQSVLVARRQPRLEVFSGPEVALVHAVIDALRGRGARDVSELSHHEVGWQVAAIGDEIPYQAIFLDDREPTEEDIQAGLDTAKELGWR
jgi:hypothetical protein